MSSRRCGLCSPSLLVPMACMYLKNKASDCVVSTVKLPKPISLGVEMNSVVGGAARNQEFHQDVQQAENSGGIGARDRTLTVSVTYHRDLANVRISAERGGWTQSLGHDSMLW